MLTLGFLTFMTPAVLIAGAVLPLVWLLLRLTPPAVRRLDFPAVRLLFNLERTERTPARTPPWLVALRIGILALAVLGLADPLLTADRSADEGPLVVVMDDGWAAANRWDARLQALRNLLERAEHRQQPVALLTTAPSLTPPAPLQLVPAREALAQTTELVPRPWPVDRADAAARLARPQGAAAGDGGLDQRRGRKPRRPRALATALAGLQSCQRSRQRTAPTCRWCCRRRNAA